MSEHLQLQRWYIDEQFNDWLDKRYAHIQATLGERTAPLYLKTLERYIPDGLEYGEAVYWIIEGLSEYFAYRIGIETDFNRPPYSVNGKPMDLPNLFVNMGPLIDETNRLFSEMKGEIDGFFQQMQPERALRS